MVKALAQRLWRAELSRHSFWMFLTQGLLVLMGVVLSVVVARIFGQQGRGVFALATAVIAMAVQFGSLGLPSASTYALARGEQPLRLLLVNGFLSALGGSALAIAAVLLWGWLWPQTLPVKGWLLVLTLAGIPGGLLFLYLRYFLLTLKRTSLANMAELAARLATLAGAGVLWLWGGLSLLWLLGLQAAALTLVCLWAYKHLYNLGEGATRPSLKVLRGQMGYGFKVFLANVFMFMVLKIDLLLVNHFMGEASTGVYAVAMSFAELMQVLPVVVGTLLFPRLSAMSDTAQKARLLQNALMAMAGLMLVGCGVMVVLIKPLVMLLYGADFMPAVVPFMVLLPAVWALGLNSLMMNFLASIGTPAMTTLAPLVAAVVNIVANVILIPTHGLVGAAVASVISYGLMLLLTTAYYAHWRYMQRIPA